MDIKTYTLKIIAIRKETEDTVTLCFKQPGLKKIRYLAGQYLTLIFRINGRRYIRPYSFSSAPLVDSFLEVTIKRVPNGIVSNYINDHLKEGDVVEVMPPLGNFVFPKDKLYTEVFLWGVGSGITPLMSLSKSVLFEEKELKVNLIYGNKNEQYTIFGEKIKELEQKYNDRLKVWHFHTSVSEEHINNRDRVIRGRIDVDKVFSTIKRENIINGLHFICGPLDLKENLIRRLGLLGVFNKNILVEDFELIRDPKDYEALENRNIILQFEGKETSIQVDKGKSILEAALDIGLELPYSCQTGSCSTCKGKLKTGNVKMIGLTAERNDLEEDEYLLCCCYPLNNKVFIVV